MDAIEKLKSFFVQRQQAYQATFAQDSPTSDAVIADLARFCRADRSSFHPDPRVHALLEGRREVYLRIYDHVKLKQDDFWKKYGNPEGKEED